MKKKKSIQELKEEGLVTTADKIPMPKILRVAIDAIKNKEDNELIEQKIGNRLLNEFMDTALPEWAKEIKMYCEDGGLIPADLIDFHRKHSKVLLKAKNKGLGGKEVKVQDFTRDKTVGKPYSPFDNPFFKSKMASTKHQNT